MKCLLSVTFLKTGQESSLDVECKLPFGFGGQASTHGSNFRVFLVLDAIKPFVNNELTMALATPVCFVRLGRFQTETLPAFSTVEK